MLRVCLRKLQSADYCKYEKTSYLFPIHLDICHIVLKHCGHVHLRELVLAEHYEEAGLPTGSITDYHQLLSDCSHLKEREQNKDIYYNIWMFTVQAGPTFKGHSDDLLLTKVILFVESNMKLLSHEI